MKRTFNYTGRKDIPASNVSFQVSQSPGGGAPSFTAQFSDLVALGLPSGAALYVEPYVGGSSAMRFAFGTVGAPTRPPNTALDELDAGGRILFRVKVVDESETVGRLLGSTQGIPPREETEESGRKPLLPLRHADLDQELCVLEIRASGGADDGPELLVNNRVPGLADRLKSDPLLQGLVLPGAVRLIVRLLFTDEVPTWGSDWRKLAESLLGEPVDWELDDREDIDEIEQIVARVVKKFGSAQRYTDRVVDMLGTAGA